MDHIFATPQLSFWERVANYLPTAKAHVSNGSHAALVSIFQILDKQINEVQGHWPVEAMHTSDNFIVLVKKAMQHKDLQSWKSCINMANALLQRAIRTHAKTSTKAYVNHCVAICAGGASGAHRLLKVFEKDQGRS